MSRKRFRLVVTCEHAGNQVPAELAGAFAGKDELLASHRGWDPGALDAARVIAKHFGAPLVFTETTRLVVDTNRTRKHPRVISDVLKDLDDKARRSLLGRYWEPHRAAVARAILDDEQELSVLHLAVHSFTPELNGEVRNADIAPLYDPARRAEVDVALRLMVGIREVAPQFRLRRNYPYRGAADGLTRAMRQRLPDARYAGIELELNQALVGTPAFDDAVAAVVHALEGLVVRDRARAPLTARPRA